MEGNASTATTGGSVDRTVSAAIVVSRRQPQSSHPPNKNGRASSASSLPHVCVAARVPRQRDGVGDPLKYTIRCFAFADDGRRFTNLDALLTRLSPLGRVHVACTESAETKNTNNADQVRKCAQVSDLLTRLCDLIDSRPADAVADDGGASSAAASTTATSHRLSSLGRPLQSDHGATEYCDRVMPSLLNGDDSIQSVQYRGNRALMDHPTLKQALGLLVREEGLEHEVGGYEVQMGRLDSHLSMDRIAAESIHLLPPTANKGAGGGGTAGGGKGGGSSDSIYGILNQCKTKMGSRVLEHWLRQPLVDRGKIESRHDVVEQLVENAVGRDRLRDAALATVLDVDVLAQKLSLVGGAGGTSGNGGLEQLYYMFLFVDQQLPLLIDALHDLLGDEDGEPTAASTSDIDEAGRGGKVRAYLTELQEVHANMSNIKGLTEAVLDFEFVPREFLVKAEYNDSLAELKDELHGIDAELEAIQQRMDEEWSEVSGQALGQVRLETTDAGGCSWQFRLPKTNDEKILRDEFTGGAVTVHRLLKNGVYFSTKELRNLGTHKQDVLAEYTTQQKSIVDNAMSVAATYVPVLEKASRVLGELDVLASFADVASYSPNGGYCRPTMTDGEDDGLGIKLINARHPCVELQDGVDFIPNNHVLEYGKSSFLLVTGPNMGGKSTYIRSLGAIVAMAQVGSFVPADSATINIVDSILARVGAGDAQQRGISTFMAEMLEASSILQSATKRSLIIIDELGRGTSTFDGFGLAWAISEYIVKKVGCITVFATHFHEITAMEGQHECVKNCHVTALKAAGSNVLTFLYEVKPGPCLESFGIQVAEMASVPQSVITNAKRKATELENFDYRTKRKGKEMDVNGNEANFGDDVVQKLKMLPIKSMVSPEEKLAAFRQVLGVHCG